MKRILTLSGLLVVAVALRAAEPVRVVMQLDWIPNAQFAGLYMAEARGFYAEAGLAVEIRPAVSGVDAVTAVQAEAGLVFGSAESSGLLAAHARGVPIRAVATMFQDSPVCWMIRADSGISSPADFVGRRVGVHDGGERIVRQALRFLGKEALLPDIHFSVVGHDPVTVAEGKVDAQQAYAIDEFVKLRLLLGEGARRLMARDYGYVAYSQVIFTPARMVEQHPEIVRAFLAATQRGWAYALAHREEAVDYLLARHAPGLARDYQLASLDEIATLVAPDGRPPLAPMKLDHWQKAQAMYVAMGELAAPLDLSTLVDLRFNPGP